MAQQPLLQRLAPSSWLDLVEGKCSEEGAVLSTLVQHRSGVAAVWPGHAIDTHSPEFPPVFVSQSLFEFKRPYHRSTPIWPVWGFHGMPYQHQTLQFCLYTPKHKAWRVLFGQPQRER